MWLQLKHLSHQLRLHHWVKNTLIGVPVFFAGRLDWLLSYSCFVLLFAFCLSSSIIYLINDLVDLPSDRQHPKKRLRPLASGFYNTSDIIKILIGLAVLLFICLTQLSASIPIIIAYLLLQIGYTFFFKKIPLFDVACIGTGFVLRILAGGWEANIWTSNWLIGLVFLLTTGLALAKRRNDSSFLTKQKFAWRTYPKYSQKMLDVLFLFFFVATFVVYVFYSINSTVEGRLGSDKIYLTSIFVFLGLARYLWVSFTQNKRPNSPIAMFWGDGFLLLIISAWLLSFTLLIDLF